MKITRIFLMSVSLLAASFPAGFIFAQPDGEPVVIGQYKIITSKILKEDRRLLVHLPENYEKTKQKYPVFFMLYGNHVNTYFTEVVSVLERLAPTGRIPEMILIGVENTDRYRDLLPQYPDGKSTGIENFITFFRDELIPYVEKTYRCKNYRLILGPQAGANFVFYTLFKEPDIFNMAIITNPFRWQGGRELNLNQAKAVLSKNKNLKKILYITYNDSDELEREGIKFIDDFAAFVKEVKSDTFTLRVNFQKNVDQYEDFLGLEPGLKILFSGYPLRDKKINNLADIKEHFANLTQEYGYEVDIPEHLLVIQYDTLLEQRKTAQADEILNYILEANPLSTNGLWRMANLQYGNGNLPEAIKNLEKMIEVMDSDVGMIKDRLNRFKKMVTDSATYALQCEIFDKGLAAGQKRYEEIKKNKKLYFDEREMNTLGYQLLGKNMADAALFIFKTNVSHFPKSANVYDSLAEAYYNTGNYKEAKKNYRKALALNPGNIHAKDILAKIDQLLTEKK